jgi:hypothetical protein
MAAPGLAALNVLGAAVGGVTVTLRCTWIAAV